MTDWLVGLSILLLAIAMPYIIMGLKASGRGKARSGGLGGLDAGFALFDPARARAVQAIEIHNDIGDAAEGDHGEAGGPPPPP